MTHGDKKAKNGKTSQASAKKISKAGASAKERGKVAVPPRKSGGSATAAGSKTGPPKSTGAKSVSAKEAAGRPIAKAARPQSDADGATFSDAALASAFKRAVKKYPNAFRRLTD